MKIWSTRQWPVDILKIKTKQLFIIHIAGATPLTILNYYEAILYIASIMNGFTFIFKILAIFKKTIELS